MEARGSSNPVGACDLCGSREATAVLEPANLDGPLVRCSSCGLHYVADRRSDLAFGDASPDVTAMRLDAANRRFRDFSRREERRLNELNAQDRLDEFAAFLPGSGRLLEVGCGRGDFLRIASNRFEVCGIEPNPALAGDASREAPVHCGRIEDAPDTDSWRNFDLIVCFHVIEHVGSPMALVGAMAQRLKPGGLLVLETPDIGSAPYRWLGARWRQFIPEHYYFFDRDTLGRLLESRGFKVRSLRHVAKRASVGLLLNRLGRQIPLLGRAGDLSIPGTIRINPGDILLAIAALES